MHLMLQRGSPHRRLLVAGLCTLLAASCGPDGPGLVDPKNDPQVASVELTAPSPSLAVGRSMQLTAVARDASGSAVPGKRFSWSSSDTTVASVDNQGVVTGRARGTVTLSAAVDGKLGSLQTAVVVPVAKIEVRPPSGDPWLGVGQTTQLTAVLRDAHGNVLTDRVPRWVTSDGKVAVVDSTGAVRGLESGSVVVSALAEGVTGATTLEVARPTLQLVPDSTLSLEVGQATTLWVKVVEPRLGEITSGLRVQWATSESEAVVVDGCHTVCTGAYAYQSISVRARRGGVARITASWKGAVATALVRVEDLTGTRSRIAFTTLRDGNAEVYVMRPDGSAPRNLTAHPAVDNNPTWAPDGRLAFSSDRQGNFDIYVVDADGGGLRRLTTDPAHDEWPAWSPDGRVLAFTSTRGLQSRPGIYAMSADGSISALRLSVTGASRPSWSPDGRKIAFQETTPRGDTEILVMNADGTGVVRLTAAPLSGPVVHDEAPAWSPDGSRIAFQSDRLGNYNIYVVNADGSGMRALTSNQAIDWHPAWSPGGSYLSFTSDRDGNLEVYRMRADGSGVHRLTTHPAMDGSPAWAR